MITGSRLGLAALHGGVLAAMDMAGVILGFAVYNITRPANQLTVQIPVAILVTVSLFLWWILALGRSRWSDRAPRGALEFAWVYAFAFVWAAIAFVPVHYLLTGYLTAFSNVLALWMYQGAANLLAIGIAVTALAGYREAASRASEGAGTELADARDRLGRSSGAERSSRT